MAKQKAIVQVKPKTNLYLVYVRMMMSLGILAAAGLIVANILIIIRVAPGSDSVRGMPTRNVILTFLIG